MAREYSIWNAAIASLQFWTADLDMITLGTAIEEVYSAVLHNINLYTMSAMWWNIIWSLCDHIKCSLWTEISTGRWRLWKWFRKLHNANPLRKMPKIHHISSIKNASFNPDPVTPCSMFQSHLRLVRRWLTYSSSNDNDTSEEETPTALRATPDAQAYLEEDEDDFQMVPLDDEHWTTEEVPDRTLCIHEHALPHGLCLYLCPYANYFLPSYTETMNFSDISDFEDIMKTSSDEDIPGLEDAPYWDTLVCIEH